MFGRKGKFASADCEHLSTVIVRNSGIERTVCEACGNVSFRGIEGLSGTVDRGRFERNTERPREPVASG
jgi:hypothetical protein